MITIVIDKYGPFSLCTDDDECVNVPNWHEYINGRLPPHYPVPAIIRWYEFGLELGCYRVGTDLFDKYVVLILCESGRYPCD